MKKTDLTRKSWILLVLVTLCVLVFTVSRMAANPAQSAQPAGETYSWSGELVALDESARMMTVKARVVGDQAPAELGRFKAGERIMLTWSGFFNYADAVNRAVRYEATKKSDERFTFPVEFVSFDAAHQYVTFKTAIPADSVGKVKSLKPGEWVTATSPHGKVSETQPIVAVRPYGAVSSTSTN